MKTAQKNTLNALLALVGAIAYTATSGWAQTTMVPGQDYTVSGAKSSYKDFILVVPPGQDWVWFSSSGGTGDCDLYVKKGELARSYRYDYKSAYSGTYEDVSFPLHTGTLCYASLYGWASYSNVKFVGSYWKDLPLRCAFSGLSDLTGKSKYYAVSVPTRKQKLQIQIYGGTGDCDLYVRKVNVPTTTKYDYWPNKRGNSESVDISNPSAGLWFIMLRAHSSYSGVTLYASCW